MSQRSHTGHEPKPTVNEGPSPSWDALYLVAEAQQGCFTAEQARDAGISDQLLQKHLANGNIERLHRGIYRLTRFPAAGREQEDLVVVWLWSTRTAVFSHETALQLRGLSDAMPANIHITLPLDWKHRRMTPPNGVRTYFADLIPTESSFVGAVPVTTPTRAIVDVANAHGDANVIEAAIRQAVQRGVAAIPDLLPAVEYLARGAGRVRREAPGGMQSWYLEVLAGDCAAAPPPDWRVLAEELAHAHRGRLHVAEHNDQSHRLYLELVWRVDARPTEPEVKALRADATRRFGWR